MKPSKLIQLAALGLVASTMGGLEAIGANITEQIQLAKNSCAHSCDSCGNKQSSTCTPLTQKEVQPFYAQLDEAHKKIFDSMDCQNQRRALELGMQTKNKNEAVDSAKTEMMQKRANTMQP